MLFILLICLVDIIAIDCIEHENIAITVKDVVKCKKLFVSVSIPQMTMAVYGGEGSIAKLYGVILKRNKQFIIYDARSGFRSIPLYFCNAIWSGLGMVVSFFLVKKCSDSVSSHYQQMNLEQLSPTFIGLGALGMLFCGVNAYLGFDTLRAWRKHKRRLLKGYELTDKEMISIIKNKNRWSDCKELWASELNNFKWDIEGGEVDLKEYSLDLYCSKKHRFRQELGLLGSVSRRVCSLLNSIKKEEDLKRPNIKLEDLMEWQKLNQQWRYENNRTPQFVTDIFNLSGSDSPRHAALGGSGISSSLMPGLNDRSNGFSFISTVPYSYYTFLYIKTKWGILSANEALEKALSNLVWRLHYSRVKAPVILPNYAFQLTEFKGLLLRAGVFEKADDGVTIENLSESWVKEKYKKAAVKLHPDKNRSTQEKSTAEFQLLNNVNESLMKFCNSELQ